MGVRCPYWVAEMRNLVASSHLALHQKGPNWGVTFKLGALRALRFGCLQWQKSQKSEDPPEICAHIKPSSWEVEVVDPRKRGQRDYVCTGLMHVQQPIEGWELENNRNFSMRHDNDVSKRLCSPHWTFEHSRFKQQKKGRTSNNQCVSQFFPTKKQKNTQKTLKPNSNSWTSHLSTATPSAALQRATGSSAAPPGAAAPPHREAPDAWDFIAKDFLCFLLKMSFFIAPSFWQVKHGETQPPFWDASKDGRWRKKVRSFDAQWQDREPILRGFSHELGRF